MNRPILLTTDAEKQFVTMLKYLTLTATAAKAPISQKMTSEIAKRIDVAGGAKNIQWWLFWTPQQKSLFVNGNCHNKLLLFGGNGIGKSELLSTRAKELAQNGEKVLFCMHDNQRTTSSAKSLLLLKMEVDFEDYCQSYDIRVMSFANISVIDALYVMLTLVSNLL